MEDKKYQDYLYACNKCGFCLSDCPTYKHTLDETYSARGLLTLAEAVQNNRIEKTAIYKDRLGSCIKCLSCEPNCPSGLFPHQLIQQAKERLVQKDGMDMSKRLFCRSIIKNQWLMGKTLRWGKTLGLFEGEMPKTAKSFNSLVPQVFNVKNPKANIGFFVGCAINLWYPKIGLAVVKVLTDAGFQVTIPKKQKCCGVPVQALGEKDSARRLIQDNVDAFADVDLVVTACASCGLMLKKDSAQLGASAKFKKKVQDITQFLVENKVKVSTRSKAKKVTYHDPCHLNRGQSISNEPRQLIEDISGLKLIEVENAKQCCGGGGTFRLFNQELAVKIAEEKIEAVRESGASALLTSCPGCIMQFNDIFRQKGSGVPVKHVVEMLADL